MQYKPKTKLTDLEQKFIAAFEEADTSNLDFAFPYMNGIKEPQLSGIITSLKKKKVIEKTETSEFHEILIIWR